MKNLKNSSYLLILILLVAVGQMAQTINVPAVTDIARDFKVSPGHTQWIMAMYLLTYGISQLFYGPLSDRLGRRPVILMGLTIFALGAVAAIFAVSLPALSVACAIQGLGTGVGGVMARTLPRDRFEGNALRRANSILNMGILVSPLLAPVLGALFVHCFNWRISYVFLLLLCLVAVLSVVLFLPETRPPAAVTQQNFLISYKALISDRAFFCYLLILVGGLAGVAVFEACSGILFGGVLGLDELTVSLLFIVPIPAAFIGAWYAGQQRIDFSTLMWHAVMCCFIAALLMWVPGWLHIISIATLLVPATLFFFGAGMLFPLATTGAMQPFPYLAGSAGALVGGIQNMGSGLMAWCSAMLPQEGQASLGGIMFGMAMIILLCWLPISSPSHKRI